MAPRRGDRMDAELIRKMELVKTEVQKHQNEMEASLNDFAKESLDGIEKKMKTIDDNMKIMTDDTESLVEMLKSAATSAKKSIADEVIRLEKMIKASIQPTSTTRPSNQDQVDIIQRRTTPKRKASARVHFEEESDDGEGDNGDDEDYVLSNE